MASPFFWNLIARSYSRASVGDQAAYETKLAKTAAHFTPQTRALEVGCGTGTTAVHHAPHVASILGVDFSPKMIAIAKAKAAAAGAQNATFRVGRLEDLPHPTEKEAFDAVLAMSILHLVPDAGVALSGLAGQLKPGGMLFTSTMCIGDTPGLLSRLLPYLGWVGLPRVSRLTADGLLAAHRAAGFEIVEQFQPAPKAALFVVGRLKA